MTPILVIDDEIAIVEMLSAFLEEEGWLYVAVILDLFSRLVVGWAMGTSNDEALVRRCPPTEMLLHSDQGSPYTSTG